MADGTRRGPQRSGRGPAVTTTDPEVAVLREALATARDAEARLQEQTERLEIQVAKLQQRLTRAQKMEMIGQLTSSVVHDFNNFLTVVLANAGSLHTVAETAGDARGMRQADMIERAAERAARLASQLLAFARKQTAFAETTAVAPLLGGMQELLRRAAAGTDELQVQFAPDVWPIRIDQAQLESALLNLVINAHDAIPAGGTIALSAENVVLAPAAAARLDTSPGDFVRIAVADSGNGIPRDLLGRIFEPFFTTKEPGKGTGLGLSQVLDFATESGGAVDIQSEPGHGTTVALLLPRAAETLAEPATTAPPARANGHGRCVLLVEDQDDLRETARAMLEDHGYRVLEAKDGPSARVILAGNVGIDVLFTDLVLPGGLCGITLAREARQMRPDIRVLLTSGYTKDMLDQFGVEGQEFDFLLKPYTTAKLTTRLTSLLGGAIPVPLMWSSAHKLGIPVMDEQHARLAELLSDLAAVLTKGEDHAAAVQEVIRYTKFHFAAEEKLMAQYGLSDTAGHVQNHRRLLADIGAFRPHAGGVNTALALDFLQAWLLNHVNGDDRVLAERLHALGGR